MAEIAGCVIGSLDESACRSLLSWVTGAPSEPESCPAVWLVAYCDDGVTWGRRDANPPGWRLANHVFPGRAPRIDEHNLQELRLFGVDLEILIWRDGSGFRGRSLMDRDEATDHLSPVDENRIVLGDRLLEDARQGFTRVGSATGAEQVVPVELSEESFRTPWPLRLRVRHYLEADEETGAVRIAVTRLVNLEAKS